MKRVLVVFTLALFLGANPVFAALTFTLTPAVKSAAKGTEVTFSGTLQNTSATDNLFLNDIQFSLTGGAAVALAPDSNSFFANVPGVLLPGETYTGPIFVIAISSTADATDYSGSVTIRGGADIFATTDLQSQNFQISSPLVSISASTPDAYEYGAVVGTFTIARTGNTNYDLLVHYAVTGSAASGVRYSSLSGLVTIPSGAASAMTNIVPIPNNIVEGDQTVVLSISPFANYNVGMPVNATVTIHDPPIDAWRLQEFGANANDAAIAGDTADPDSDGITNLMEYALYSDPGVSSIADLPLVAINGNHLQLVFRRNTSATDITYVVEARSNLSAGSWTPVMTRAPGGGWTPNLAGATALESGSGDFVLVTITDPVPIVDPNTLQPTPQRFLRLRIQR